MYLSGIFQLDQRIDQHKMTQLTLEEKRSELLSTTSTLREVEDKYYSSTATLNDKVLQDLRVRHLIIHLW